MKVTQFFVGDGRCSYVLVDDTPDNRAKLYDMGCTFKEIERMKEHYSYSLNVYPILSMKGYEFHPEKGFYKPTYKDK